jgi:TRAP-type mannitol/chloroaromatic compound transport system permease small subunit
VSVALGITRGIDELSRRVGLVAAWFVLLAALVSAFNAVFRYAIASLLWLERTVGGGVFGGLVSLYAASSNVLSESQWYLFAGAVMLGGAWTLKVNEHVRVDVLYGIASDRVRTWIDLLGHIFFLLPLCIVMVWFTFWWFYDSYVGHEVSNAYGGLVRWPVKLAMPFGFGLLGLQALSEIIKCVLSLNGRYTRDLSYQRPLQ